jgi:hypothetical protein
LKGTIKLQAEVAVRLSCSARQEKFGRSAQQSRVRQAGCYLNRQETRQGDTERPSADHVDVTSSTHVFARPIVTAIISPANYQ